MKKIQLDSRLAAAASFARRGKAFADVGTDHASLPIYLVGEGIAPRGVASDINEGPITRARINISGAGLGDKIAAVRTDGLSGLEEYSPEDVYVLGMGGELIWRIVDASPLARRTGVRLIMQPMTRAAELRRGLTEGGFSIIDEALAEDEKLGDGRIYQIIAAEYTGVREEYSEVELILGRHNIARGGEKLRKHAAFAAEVLLTRARGLESANRDATPERKLAADILAAVKEKI